MLTELLFNQDVSTPKLGLLSLITIILNNQPKSGINHGLGEDLSVNATTTKGYPYVNTYRINN
ncbi:hypothetical protein CXF86_02965 [Shewanella sp. GutCb]|nr:hypothetical protein CXF86_02965 [Shewanella sp. GutCb]